MIDRGRDPTLRFHTPDETRARLERVLARLAAHGIEVPPGSRVARFIKLSQRFADKEIGPAGLGSAREVNELIEANRDFAEFATIVEQLLPAGPPADSALLRKLNDVLGGAALPGEDANVLARSTQFELYVMALCARGGLAPLLREPDCIVTTGSARLGIAAKRANGPNVSKLVKDGARQLRKAGLFGLVAVSLDRVFAPDDQRMAADTPDGFKDAAREIAEQTVRPYLPTLDREAAGSHSLAILAVVVVPVVLPHTNSIGRVEAGFLHALRSVTEAQAAALLELNDRLRE